MRPTSSGPGILVPLAAVAALVLPGMASGQPTCPLVLCPTGEIAVCKACPVPDMRLCPDGTLQSIALKCPASPEASCAKDMAKAQAKLLKSLEAVAFKHYAKGGDTAKAQKVIEGAVDKLVLAYQAAEQKAVAAGGTCPNANDVDAAIAQAAETVGIRIAQATGTRFVANADGTVLDQVRQLVWETKAAPSDGTPSFANPRDVDNTYTWGSLLAPYPANGTVFTDFLAKLNGSSGSCFASACDWRMPTLDEMASLLPAPFPECSTYPCLHPSFGPIAEGGYWSGTTFELDQGKAHTVEFEYGYADTATKNTSLAARAVRAAIKPACSQPTLCPSGFIALCRPCPPSKQCPDGTIVFPSNAPCPKSAESACAAALTKARALLEKNLDKAALGFYLDGETTAQTRIDTARMKFEASYQKAHEKAVQSGGSCPSPDTAFELIVAATIDVGQRVSDVAGIRYERLDGLTVTDRLTGLEWEMKEGSTDQVENVSDPHDIDNFYTWSAQSGGAAANGTAFTDFLAKLNGGSGACYAGKCDWRLPTLEELRQFPPCTVFAGTTCLEAFGPAGMLAGNYWSASTDPADAGKALVLNAVSLLSSSAAKSGILPVRAVRSIDPVPTTSTTTSTSSSTTSSSTSSSTSVSSTSSSSTSSSTTSTSSSSTSSSTTTTVPLQCGTSNKCIFVTSTNSNGNLGGLSGADAKCNARAVARGLPGTYVAWLSSSSVNAVSRIASSGPFVKPAGGLVASSVADLTDGTLSSAIDQNEFGTFTASEAWTGTGADGIKDNASGFSTYCNNWTTSGGEVVVGLSNAADATWTVVYLQFCNRILPLYCIQQ